MTAKTCITSGFGRGDIDFSHCPISTFKNWVVWIYYRLWHKHRFYPYLLERKFQASSNAEGMPFYYSELNQMNYSCLLPAHIWPESNTLMRMKRNIASGAAKGRRWRRQQRTRTQLRRWRFAMRNRSIQRFEVNKIASEFRQTRKMTCKSL